MSKQWSTVSLGDVITERRETPPPYDIENGTIRIVSKIVFKDGRILLREGCQTNTGMILIRPGDIVVSGINAAKGAIASYDEANKDNIAATIHYGAYIPNKDKVDARWLWWFLRSQAFRNLLMEYVPGGIKTELKAKRLLPVPICIPSLSEQRRIVARIEKLAAKISEAQELRRQAAEEAEAFLVSFASVLCYKNHPLCLFREILLEAKNGIYKPPEYWGSGIPCIRMYNIEGPAMNTNQIQLLDVTPEEFEVYSCRPGDLIFNRVNSAELVGKTGLITEKYPKCTFESKNMRLRVDLKKALPEYVARVLNSKETRAYYRETLKQQCGMATLNQGHVYSIPFPLPSLSEQRRIVAYLDNLQAKADALKKLQEETGKELDAMIPAVLDRAFKGEL